jgi:hypothetical protein
VRKILNLAVLVISLVTLLSGLTQMIAPRFILGMVGAETTATAAHFFAIVGMFMAIFGGLMLHTLYSPLPSRPAIWWCAVQKLGAFVAVSLGVVNGIFSPMALAVAGFDLFSGILFLFYLKTVYSNETG